MKMKIPAHLYSNPMSNPIKKSLRQQAKTIDTYEKGRLFEEYVIDLFNRKYFYVKEWRMSKKADNTSNLIGWGNPDLELVFTGSKKYRFAVECKWQKGFTEGKIAWATKNKIEKYVDFEWGMRIPVFIVIGIGGEPSNPEKLFVTPLCNICMYTEVYEHQLVPYKRNPSRRFYYDTVQLKLF